MRFSFSVVIAMCAIVISAWLFYDLDRSSALVYIEAEESLSLLQKKRHVVSEMSSAARERTIILVQMMNEKDVFERDKMSLLFYKPAQRFNKNREIFSRSSLSPAEKKKFNYVLDMVRETSDKLRLASDLLISGDDALAKKVLFSEVFPNHNAIVIAFDLIQQLITAHSQDEINNLEGQVETNRQKLIYLMLFLILISFVSVFQVRARFKSKEVLITASETKFRALYDNAPDMYVSVAPENNRITLCNETLLDVTGYRREELIGRSIFKVYHPDSIEVAKAAFQQLQKTGSVRDTELLIVLKDGSTLDVSLNVDAVRDRHGKILYSLSSWRDITERKRSEYVLKQQRLAMDCHSIIATTDIKGTITYVNSKFCDISGYNKQELIGQNHRVLNSGNQDKEYWKAMFHTIANGNVWQDEVRNTNKEGQFYWVDTTIVPFMGKNGKPESYISIRTDITARKMVVEKISYQASHDSLTGLINRREFESRLQHLMNHADNDKCHVLLYLDLDQFKVVNDTCGHHAGDELLRRIPQLITSCTRRSDVIARLGGDEFAIVLNGCDLGRAEDVSKAVLESVSSFRFTWDNQVFKIGVSIGIVEMSDSAKNLHDVLKHADTACYEAKERGRNRACIYTESNEVFIARSEQMNWVTKINKALSEDLFVLFAQPIVAVNEDSSSKPSYELLIRINDKGKIIPPFAFIPAAERYNLMVDIDRWVVEKTFFLLKNNMDFLLNIDHISINLSGQSIADEFFMQFLVKEIEKSNLSDKICIEITETAAIGNISNAIEFIDILHGMGVRFSLDDFGSGLSSFSYLKTLNVDFLKIDGVFIKNIVTDPIDRAMVESIHKVAQVMGKQTIAEFVENDEIKSVLREIGVDYAQGYGIAKPIPFEDVLANETLFLEQV